MAPDSPLPGHRAELVQKIIDLQEGEALDLVRARISSHDDPLEIVEDCQEGLRGVGERYERREYFLSGLIMGGEIFSQAMEILTPTIKANISGSGSGLILIGTVRGDIHDIGKNIASLLLTSYGFIVQDLGVNVPPQEFLNQAARLRPDIIGLSGLLATSYDGMRDTVRLVRACADARIASTPVIIGGGQLTADVSQWIGADAWVTDAMAGVHQCQALLQKNPRR